MLKTFVFFFFILFLLFDYNPKNEFNKFELLKKYFHPTSYKVVPKKEEQQEYARKQKEEGEYKKWVI